MKTYILTFKYNWKNDKEKVFYYTKANTKKEIKLLCGKNGCSCPVNLHLADIEEVKNEIPPNIIFLEI